VIVEAIPRLALQQRNEARRFNILIDTLYEASTLLIASAEVPPDDIYIAGDGTFEFQRTVSRLIEMQSEDYITNRPRRWDNDVTTLTDMVLNIRLVKARVGGAHLAYERSSRLLYSFEDFSLDTARRELRRSGALISLQPQVFDLLEYSIRNRERVVSKDDLLAAVWHGRIVSESTLSTRINTARSAIGDSGEEQRLLRTAHGKGIRFVGAVREEEETVRKLAAILAADVEGYSRLMGQDEVGTLRRLTACRAILDERVAAYHGRIFGSAGDSVVADFASAIDAVQCAVAVQDAIAKDSADRPMDEQMRFRIGVHVGDLIVQGENLFDDGVNIAARLEALAEPGGICISGTVRDYIGTKLPIAFTDLGEQQVKNISQPVHVYRVVAGRATQAAEAPASTPLLPDKPSIAVLPFIDMSGDLEQEFFSDGISEDIITALSHYSSLFVIARNSCCTYKGRAVDVKQVGHELGVRYALEGSVRKAGNRIRVTAQLVEAETGIHVWAERYDRDLADVFALQDEVTQAVAIAIAPAIAEAERKRAMRRPPGSIDAWAAYQRGLWHFSKSTVEDNALAEKFFQQAIDVDPTFAGSYTGLAFAHKRMAGVFGRRSLPETEKLMEALVRQALHSTPTMPKCVPVLASS
jgi:TolB-like protein/DNA-binding winged helix-turn-helix (wHTH) protein